MNCSELNDHYELFAFGIAEEPERSEIAVHLDRNCGVCGAAMRRAVELTSLLSATSPDVRPSGKLRRRILASVGVERGSLWAPVWAATAVLALVLTVYLGDRWQREIDTTAALRRELSQRQVDNVRLNEALAIISGPDTALASFGNAQPRPPRGKVYVNPRRGVLLMATNLPPAPAGKLYEMWMLPKAGNPIPAGLFQSGDDGNAMNIRSGAVDLSQTKAVAVTVENQEGAAQPTSQPLIVAALPVVR